MTSHSRPKCRLIFVIDDMGVGGAQKQVREVVNRLDRERFSADVVCISEGGANAENLIGAGEVFCLGARRLYDNQGVAAAGRLATIIRRGRYHVAEAYLPSAHLLCAMALAGTRRTALVAARRHVAALDPRWMGPATALLNRATWFSIANSRAVKRSVVERYGVPASRVAVVGNIIEMTSMPREDARRELGIGQGEFVISAAASFSRVKDYPTIVRAFAGFMKAHGRSVLLLAGDGPLRPAVAALAASLGLDGQVRFLGTVADVSTVLSASDAFVHASLSEGLSNAVLEAMAAGVPVVATDIPANREALGPDCGFLFGPGDWKGCLEGMERYASDGRLAAEAGKRCRRRVAAAFDSTAILKRRERIYRRLQEVIDGGYR